MNTDHNSMVNVILNAGCQPKCLRQTVQNQIRQLLKKQSDQGLACFYSDKHFVNSSPENKTSSTMGNDRSPWSQHYVWRHHNLRCSKAGNSELETLTRN